MRPDEEVLGAPPANEKLTALLTAYYKTYRGGRAAVHQMKIAGGAVLYDSRRDHRQGLYPHGEYPFVAWYYDRLPGTPWGFGAFDYLAPCSATSTSWTR